MANTISNSIQNSGVQDCFHFTLVSDGSEETGLTIYDPGNYHSVPGTVTKIRKIIMSVSADTAFSYIAWDADVDVMAVAIPPAACNVLDFDKFRVNGIQPPFVSGLTGKLKLTTTGLDSGDCLSLTVIVQHDAVVL